MREVLRGRKSEEVTKEEMGNKERDRKDLDDSPPYLLHHLRLHTTGLSPSMPPSVRQTAVGKLCCCCSLRPESP